MSGRPQRDSVIREQAIENAVRERFFGLEPAPPRNHLRLVSLDTNAPEPGQSDLPRGGRVRGSLRLILLAGLAVALVLAGFVV